MSYVHPCNNGNLEDETRKSSGALFRSDSFFVVWAIHVVITSVHTVPYGERAVKGRENVRVKDRKHSVNF